MMKPWRFCCRQKKQGSGQRCSMEDQCLLKLWDQIVVENGVLYRQYISGNVSSSTIFQLVVRQTDRKEIIRQIHGGDTGCHLRVAKTVHILKEWYYWPGHWNKAKLFCRTCTASDTWIGTTSQPRAPLQSVQAGYLMQLVASTLWNCFQRANTGASTL